MTVAEIEALIRQKLEGVKSIAQTVEGAARDFTEEERGQITQVLNDVDKLQGQLKELKEGDAFKERVTESLKGAEGAKTAEEINQKALEGAVAGKALGAPGSRPVSIGEQFVKSQVYENFLKQFPTGIPDQVTVQTSPYVVGGFKDLVTSASLTGLIQPDVRGLQDPIWGRELSLRDVLTIGQTGSDIVEYARLLSATNAAAPVPEASTFADVGGEVTAGEGGVKPFSTMSFERVVVPVRNIAHLVATTRRALSDAGQLITLIDNFLRWGLGEEVEDQVMSGDGSGENFTGILETSGTLAQPWDGTLVRTIRKAITRTRVVGRARPTAVGMSPATDERLDLLQDKVGRFYGAGPFGTGPSTIWGLPRFVSEVIPDDAVIVADWRQAVLWDREQTSIVMTEAHKDWFGRNLVAVRGELRAAFGILRPSAFTIIDVEDDILNGEGEGEGEG